MRRKTYEKIGKLKVSAILQNKGHAYHKHTYTQTYIFSFSVKELFYFPASLVSIIIYSYNENLLQILCLITYKHIKQVPSILQYM